MYSKQMYSKQMTYSLSKLGSTGGRLASGRLRHATRGFRKLVSQVSPLRRVTCGQGRGTGRTCARDFPKICRVKAAARKLSRRPRLLKSSSRARHPFISIGHCLQHCEEARVSCVRSPQIRDVRQPVLKQKISNTHPLVG